MSSRSTTAATRAARRVARAHNRYAEQGHGHAWAVSHNPLGRGRRLHDTSRGAGSARFPQGAVVAVLDRGRIAADDAQQVLGLDGHRAAGAAGEHGQVWRDNGHRRAFCVQSIAGGRAS